ncbi:type II toxin-antitoxin system RelB family antitoxin [Deferrisoma camini]|uniref:type II toxin-antitoxin system RelB family antitoxin n=1 Tax=Deferrisoma camini TaxID=1035120 RepID=UPI00247FEC06|nr:ribbon-helix-helix protein, CopG family [Deferrisoma camini]
MGMLSLRLPEDLQARLNRLAEMTARPKGYYVREALKRYLDDLEDVYLAEKRLEDLRAGKDLIVSHEDFWDGLDD